MSNTHKCAHHCARYCDFCGKQIRYGHHLVHKDWPEPIVVCAACATQLTGTDCYERERLFRARNAVKDISPD